VDDPATSPNPNGCSNPFLNPPESDNPAGCECSSFLEACNAHDTCYATCWGGQEKKDYCDDILEDGMDAVCTSDDCIFESCYNSCNSWANIYDMAVRGAGGPWYRSAQVEACACCNCSE